MIAKFSMYNRHYYHTIALLQVTFILTQYNCNDCLDCVHINHILGARNGKNKEILIDLTNTKVEKPQAKRKAQPSQEKNSKQHKIENDNIGNF